VYSLEFRLHKQPPLVSLPADPPGSQMSRGITKQRNLRKSDETSEVVVKQMLGVRLCVRSKIVMSEES
jgi:hypothetical protein